MNQETLQKILDQEVGYVDTFHYDGISYGMGGFRTEWLTAAVQNPKVIFDVGCYDCGDSVRFKTEFKDSQVFAFEASPERFQMTEPTANRYGINIYQKAVCEQTGTRSFYNSLVDGSRIDAQGSFFKHSEYYKNRNPRIHQNNQPTIVNTISLKDFCEQNSIKDIDLLHVDVEGAEFEVIKGMGDIRPKVIFVETLDIIDNMENKSWVDGGADSLEMERYLFSIGYIIGKIMSADRLYYHNSVIE